MLGRVIYDPDKVDVISLMAVYLRLLLVKLNQLLAIELLVLLCQLEIVRVLVDVKDHFAGRGHLVHVPVELCLRLPDRAFVLLNDGHFRSVAKLYSLAGFYDHGVRLPIFLSIAFG